MKIVRNSGLPPVFDFTMQANLPQDDARETRLDENDPVWRLLGESPRPEPDAWFAVRTLARCRHNVTSTESYGFLFGRVWRWTLGGGLGFCLAVVLFTLQIPWASPSAVKKQNVQEAFEIVASLDSPDADSTSNSTWQDSSY